MVLGLFLGQNSYSQVFEATYSAKSWTEMGSGEEKLEPAKVIFYSNKVSVELGSQKLEGTLLQKTEGEKKVELLVLLNGKETTIKILTFGKPSLAIKNDSLNVLINCE
jgi:hypothetical protein